MSGIENVVLVSIDDLRYDCIGPAKPTGWLDQHGLTVETPTFDRLAETGTLFHDTVSTSSYTPPSHASLFSGLYPKNHGVKTFFNSMSPGVDTLAEAFSRDGYRTTAWIENIALDILDVTRGFDTVRCPFEEDEHDLFEFVEAAGETDRTFTFVHLFDVHKPYIHTPGGGERHQYNERYLSELGSILDGICDPSAMLDAAEAEAREQVDRYDDLPDSLREYATYRSLDYLIRQELESQVGDDRFQYLAEMYARGVEVFDTGRFADLIERLRAVMPEDYLLIVTSDHGETRCRWRDREDFFNSFNVSEGAVRVPLFVESDQWAPAVDQSTPVNHVDLAPTIADVVGLEWDGPADGVSLAGEGPDDDRYLYNESWFYEGGANFFGTIRDPGDGGLSEAAVRQYPYKFVRSFAETGSPERALYHIEADPLERDPLPDNHEMYEPLALALESYLDGVSQSCEPNLEQRNSDEMEERLRALGYLE
ncbi:sulfatase family protein [Halorientalis pallida]|uniref:Sulfatase N-terminal domain-containing protein n=1 Tax=Halorientalis pallida TaxID=2479928 RepID=A0A498KV96_9EURY|nr:sulfatase-like hydrolase/transferase [Halorientalis pallida]RXK47439.1 hypothetical protein EAF64_16830 [Halorientalis pallida]